MEDFAGCIKGYAGYAVGCLHVPGLRGCVEDFADCIKGYAGYAVGSLHVPGYELPGEDMQFQYPGTLAPRARS